VMLRALVDAVAEKEEQDLKDWLDTNKQDIVCTIYNSLETGERQAVQDLREYFDDDNLLSFGEKIILKNMFLHDTIRIARLAYANNSQFAIDNVTVDYCLDCTTYDWYERTSPMCDGWATSSFNCCSGGIGMSRWPDKGQALSPKFGDGAWGSDCTVTLVITGTSTATGTVGGWRLFGYDAADVETQIVSGSINSNPVTIDHTYVFEHIDMSSFQLIAIQFQAGVGLMVENCPMPCTITAYTLEIDCSSP